jgi:hypothetical protein
VGRHALRVRSVTIPVGIVSGTSHRGRGMTGPGRGMNEPRGGMNQRRGGMNLSRRGMTSRGRLSNGCGSGRVVRRRVGALRGRARTASARHGVFPGRMTTSRGRLPRRRGRRGARRGGRRVSPRSLPIGRGRFSTRRGDALYGRGQVGLIEARTSWEAAPQNCGRACAANDSSASRRITLGVRRKRRHGRGLWTPHARTRAATFSWVVP